MTTSLHGRTRIATRFVLTLLVASIGLGAHATSASATTFTVDHSDDGTDVSIGDGNCETAAGHCSLRAAIQEFNSESPDYPYIVHFAVTNVTVQNSTPPKTLFPITVDGCSGAASPTAPCVTISFDSAGSALVIGGSESTVKNVAFQAEDNSATALAVDASGVTVIGNWFGMGHDGSPGGAGGWYRGLSLSENANNAVIGGDDESERNVFVRSQTGIAIDSADDATISGNYFSTNASGANANQGAFPVAPVGTAISVEENPSDSSFNLVIGGEISPDALITPECDGVCNLIGASSVGIDMPDVVDPLPLGAVIAGNYIGVTKDGTASLGVAGAGSKGIQIGDAVQSFIGGDSPADRNVIGGNWGTGIYELGTTGVLTIENNYIGLNAAGTAALAATDAGLRVAGSGNAPTTVENNRFAHHTGSGSALIVAGSQANVLDNAFGIGTGGEMLPLRQAILVTGADNVMGDVQAGRNIICGASGTAAIVVDGASATGNIIGATEIGSDVDGAGGGCTGATNHSGIRIQGGASNTYISAFEVASTRITNTLHDAIFISGNGTGNHARYVTADDIGEQVIDIGPGATGDGVGNPSNEAGDVDAPSILYAGIGSTNGQGAVPGAVIYVYETTSADGATTQQLKRYLGSVTVDVDGNWILYPSLLDSDVGARLTALQVLSNGSTSEFSPGKAAIDNARRVTSITSKPASVTRSRTATFAFSTVQAGSVFTCSLVKAGSAPDYSSCASSKSYTSLTDGTYEFAVYATNPLNIQGIIKSVTFRVDATLPSLSVPSTTWRISAGGKLKPTYRCFEAGGGCAGTVVVRSASRVRLANGTRRIVSFGSATFSAPTSALRTLSIPVSLANRRLVRRYGQIQAKATFTVRDAAGNKRVIVRTVYVRKPV